MHFFTINSVQTDSLLRQFFLPSLKRVEPHICPVVLQGTIEGNGDWCSEGWHRMILFKTLSLLNAVQDNMGSYVMFADVDIVFRHPFILAALHALGNRDIVLQAEEPDGDAVNTGLIYMRCTPAIRRVFARTLEAQIFNPSKPGQPIFETMLRTSGLLWDVLPRSFENGTNGGEADGDPFLYHATCTHGEEGVTSIQKKERILRRRALHL